MRKEYLDLQKIGGLLVNNSLLNKVNLVQRTQDLKTQQLESVSNLRIELSDNIVQTLRALSATEKNEKKVTPYVMNNSPLNPLCPIVENSLMGLNPSPYDYRLVMANCKSMGDPCF